MEETTIKSTVTTDEGGEVQQQAETKTVKVNEQEVTVTKGDDGSYKANPLKVEQQEEGETAPTEDVSTEITNSYKEVQQVNDFAKETVTKAGLDFEALTNEVSEHGTLTPESFKKLEEVGYPKEAVEHIIFGIQAKEEAFVNSIFKAVGGEKEFQTIAESIKTNGDAEAFNKLVNTGDANLIISYLNGQKAQLQLKHGTKQPLVMGQLGTGEVLKGFASDYEMKQAFKDPRYQQDPEYRAQVLKRNTITYQNKVK